MKVFKQIGSKERFVEMFQNVNKIKLNEAFGQTLNPQTILFDAFNELKAGALKIEHTNTQSQDNESFVELMCVDKQDNNVSFVFKASTEEADQDGVFTINEVTLESFSFDSVEGDESVELGGDTLRQFSNEHQDELVEVVNKFINVEEEEPIDTLYEDAVKLIDKIPYKAGSERMTTHAQYANEKPTNPKVRVDAKELKQFVKEQEGKNIITNPEITKLVDDAIENYYQISQGKSKEEIVDYANKVAQKILIDAVKKAAEKYIILPDVLINGLRQEIVDEVTRRLFSDRMIRMNENDDYPEGLGREFKPESQTDYAKKTKAEKKRKSKKVKIKEYYSVVDSEFNREHFGEFIGQILDKPLPYAQVRLLKEEYEIDDEETPEESPELNQIEKDNPDVYPDRWKQMDGMFMQPNAEFKPEDKQDDGMSLEPENDEVAQLMQDKDEIALHAKEILDIAQGSTEGEEEEKTTDIDDKEMTDALLGYKPLNIGETFDYGISEEDESIKKYQEYKQKDFNTLGDDEKEEYFRLWAQFKDMDKSKR